MTITTTYNCDPEDFYESYHINVNDKCRVSVGTPEPEDASLSRDLSFAFDIVPLMKEAYDAGRRGDVLTIKHITSNKQET